MTPTVSDETVAANPSPASASLRTESNMGQMQEYLQKKNAKSIKMMFLYNLIPNLISKHHNYDTATIPSNKAQHKPRKQCLPYTRSLLRPILVHTSPNARPIKGIGQAGHKDGFNMGAITGRASTC